MFDWLLLLDIGSTEEYWKRQDAAQVIALVEYTFMAFNVFSISHYHFGSFLVINEV